MKVMVTESARFIGFCLATRPVKEEHEVLGFDNVNDYYSVELKKALLCGTFYYLCRVWNGYSRYVVHHEIRERM